MDPYPAIYKHLFRNGFTPERIITIQNGVDRLRELYRRRPYRIPYDDIEIRDAYLSAYYPAHVFLLEHIFRTHFANELNKALNQDHVHAVIIGGGPAPEILSLVGFINVMNSHGPRLSVDIYDYYPAWQEILSSITGYALSSVPRKQSTSFTFHKGCDFRECNANCSRYKDSCTPALNQADIVVMQNFFGDLHGDGVDHTNITRSIECVINRMKSGSILIISDLNYPCVGNCISLLKLKYSSMKLIEKENYHLEWERLPSWMKKSPKLAPRSSYDYISLLISIKHSSNERTS